MNQVIEHCGNFSPEVLEGMIGYGREADKGRGKIRGKNALPAGDGYATREADILLGGFIQRQAAQEAAHDGQSLSKMEVQEKERLACRVAREHLEKHGPSGNEHYGHWMIRARAFAKRHDIALPARESRQTDHEYFRKVRRWIKERPENHPSQGDFSRKWPELKRAAGTHLVLSPDPKIWQAIRATGLDERLFLKTVATQTMKDFSDWRRNLIGTGHALGWVAGTHVRDNGADRHPHIHLVVMKRDEAGKELDWSVSCLKGHQGRTDPDPMKELKRAFGKNVERHLERMVGKENVPSREQDRSRENVSRHQSLDRQLSPALRSLARGLRAIETATQTNRPSSSSDPWAQIAREVGAMMRFIAVGAATVERFMEGRRRAKEREAPEPPRPKSNIEIIHEFLRRQGVRLDPPRSRDRDIEIEPDF